MANYVLSPAAARRLSAMMRGRYGSGRTDGDGARTVDEQEYPHPFELTYAASSGAVDSQTGAAAGAWIIWVPQGAVHFNGSDPHPELAMTAANGYPTGWYDLTSTFDGGTAPESFTLSLVIYTDDVDYCSMFFTDDEDPNLPDSDDVEAIIRIAVVHGKTVEQIVKGAIDLTRANRKITLNIMGEMESSSSMSELPEETVVFKYPGNASDPANQVVDIHDSSGSGGSSGGEGYSGNDAPFPWQLRKFSPSTQNGSPEWRVWIPVAAITFVYGNLARQVLYDSSTGTTLITSNDISSGLWGSANYSGAVDSTRTASAVSAGYSGVWASVSVAAAGGSVFLRIYSASNSTMPPATVQLVDSAPSGRDATVNHPVQLTDDGFYIKIASVNSEGVITQCVRSMLTLSIFTDGVVQKMLAPGNGISIQESNGVITISATGGGGEGGGSGVEVDSFVGYSGPVVLASLPEYDSTNHRLVYTPVTMTFDNGRLSAMEAASSPTVITTAVEETA